MLRVVLREHPPMSTVVPLAPSLLAQLRTLLGDDAVLTDRAEREAYSADVYVRGATCAAVIRPTSQGSMCVRAAEDSRTPQAIRRGASNRWLSTLRA
jgi:hypothetical protein